MGLHVNMIAARAGSTRTILSLIIGRYLPFLVGFTREDVRRLYPYMQKNVYEILKESGYMHIQATKPDTAGILLCLLLQLVLRSKQKFHYNRACMCVTLIFSNIANFMSHTMPLNANLVENVSSDRPCLE